MTFAESVLEAVHIATVDASGALGPDVKVGASDPTRGGDGRRRGPGADGQARRREPSKSSAPGTPKGVGRPTATCACAMVDLSPDRRRSPKLTIASWPRGSGSDRYRWTCAMRACSSWGSTPPTWIDSIRTVYDGRRGRAPVRGDASLRPVTRVPRGPGGERAIERRPPPTCSTRRTTSGWRAAPRRRWRPYRPPVPSAAGSRSAPERSRSRATGARSPWWFRPGNV